MNLAKHFAERHAEPLLDMTKILDKEAIELWQLYSTADKDDIKLISNRSDLRFSEQDITNTIRSLKSKNSSGFDQVSSKMIKEIPEHFQVILPHAYNQLFSAAYWGSEWKLASTIYLNKSDNPAPATNQLRPISMLPVFSKVYEKPHQATTSRVNCLLEQITQSQRYNTLTPVIYVDFLQAFDKLWQQGLLLKLNKLDCPPAYLVWMVNYFTSRSLKIDYGGIEPVTINVKRRVAQSSCLGPVMYLICHYDLPQLFANPVNVHAYVNDIIIVYIPSIHLKCKHQIIQIEKDININMQNLLNYANDWHLPLNPNKIELVNYHKAVQSPKLDIYYAGVKILQKRDDDAQPLQTTYN
ncbi:unnamed protein product [Rotaria socialis]|uniref:Reverse transcriptase domain-containing protein n=1 Tax=Rotaria socialis TaxID=392032 RepID=A0A820UK44_9BILA|nr:unnamed protein product [Rotaria socialis]